MGKRISEQLAYLQETYMSTFFRLNSTFLKQKVEHRLEIPENYKRLSESILSQRKVPYMAAIGSVVFALSGAYLQDSHKAWAAVADSVGKVGVPCIEKSVGYGYEGKHTGLKGLLQTEESEVGSLNTSENEINGSLGELSRIISSIASSEQSIASQ